MTDNSVAVVSSPAKATQLPLVSKRKEEVGGQGESWRRRGLWKTWERADDDTEEGERWESYNRGWVGGRLLIDT